MVIPQISSIHLPRVFKPLSILRDSAWLAGPRYLVWRGSDLFDLEKHAVFDPVNVRRYQVSKLLEFIAIKSCGYHVRPASWKGQN